jgi:hypothetical protein
MDFDGDGDGNGDDNEDRVDKGDDDKFGLLRSRDDRDDKAAKDPIDDARDRGLGGGGGILVFGCRSNWTVLLKGDDIGDDDNDVDNDGAGDGDENNLDGSEDDSEDGSEDGSEDVGDDDNEGDDNDLFFGLSC